ncbi:RNA polymerase sigma factor [Aestuariivivens sediminicola]|uniref:RNA polymerase sigma factor n=1 Tax=Aestuariivivens sediminicola TaxID=2913560 RepID=UPI001F5A6B62|nr:sigma-70 family RNA polymerase sigma factor [Aestuariivivens sediminicola]
MSIKNLNNSVCDENVFENIYNKYATDLNNFLFYKFGAQYHPDDKVQEAFIKLWDNCKTIAPNKARAYLFTVANNLMLNAIKHNNVVLKYSKEKQKTYTYETPEFIVEEKEFLEQYKRILESLSEEQRIAFMLSKVEGKKHREIAEILNVTLKVVEYRIYSAFKILKSELKGFKIK